MPRVSLVGLGMGDSSIWVWSPIAQRREPRWPRVIYFYFYFSVFSSSLGQHLRLGGGSQARGLIGAVADGLRQSHSNKGSELCVYDLHHSSQQCQILNPLSEAMDQTQNLVVPSQIH